MSQVLILTGMHRSGTSLISNLLQRAGIHMGEKLIAANSANPRGYFEDVDFYEFHEQLLRDRRQTYLYLDSDFSFEPTEKETARAQQLLAERSHVPIWGWKDPRTSLFLDFWRQLIPVARFLFVYRHPIEVLLSLLRRGEFDSHPSLVAGLHAWQIYNSNIVTFYQQHPERCLLVPINSVVHHTKRFAQLLQEKLEVEISLESDAFDQLYHANELKKTSFPPELNIVLQRLCPKLIETYRQLGMRADLRCDPVESRSVKSTDLSQLVQFTESLSPQINASIRDSMIRVLIATLDPERTEKMLTCSNHIAKETQRKVDQLWLEVQRLQRLNSERDAELARKSAEFETLCAELDRIHEMRIWKVVRSCQRIKGRWIKAA